MRAGPRQLQYLGEYLASTAAPHHAKERMTAACACLVQQHMMMGILPDKSDFD
jgi:hypothetical protein